MKTSTPEMSFSTAPTRPSTAEIRSSPTATRPSTTEIYRQSGAQLFPAQVAATRLYSTLPHWWKQVSLAPPPLTQASSHSRVASQDGVVRHAIAVVQHMLWMQSSHVVPSLGHGEATQASPSHVEPAVPVAAAPSPSQNVGFQRQWIRGHHVVRIINLTSTIAVKSERQADDVAAEWLQPRGC
jgi:hypothetical protein